MSFSYFKSSKRKKEDSFVLKQISLMTLTPVLNGTEPMICGLVEWAVRATNTYQTHVKSDSNPMMLTLYVLGFDTTPLKLTWLQRVFSEWIWTNFWRTFPVPSMQINVAQTFSGCFPGSAQQQV